MVMRFRCSGVIHACPPGANAWRIRRFDLSDPAHPAPISTYAPSRKPHERYCGSTRRIPERALPWLSTPTSSADPNVASLVITDIDVRNGLYVLRCTGARSRGVSRIRFLAGNSCLGDAIRRPAPRRKRPPPPSWQGRPVRSAAASG